MKPVTKATEVPLDYVLECVSVDIDSGQAVWRRRPESHCASQGERSVLYTRRYEGKPVSLQVGIEGYRFFKLTYEGRRHRIKMHRLVLAVALGGWPQGMVDHINGDPLDNRRANLRLVDRKGNAQNRRRASRNSSTGYLGVCRTRRSQKFPFRARIRVDGKQFDLGGFETAEAAYEAYVAAKRRLHPASTL